MHYLFLASTADQAADAVSDAAEAAVGAASDLVTSAGQSIDYLQQIVDYLIGKVHVLVGALIILIIGLYIIKFIRKIVSNSLDRSKMDASATSFINSLVKFGLNALLAIIVVTKLGVDTTSIIALITSASLAVGLAMQGSLSNFAGGVLLLIMKPFKVGDYINDGCGHEGTVTSIEIIYTRLLTADNQTICIPNGKLADSTITNVTQQDKRRYDFEVGIEYNEDIDKVREILLNIATQSAFYDSECPPQVFVSSFDNSAVKVVLRFWCATENYWPARFEIQENIKKAFDAAHITIPFDQMDVHIINNK